MCYASDYPLSPEAHQLCNSGSQCGFYVNMKGTDFSVGKNFPSGIEKKFNYGLHNATMVDGKFLFRNFKEIESCAPRMDKYYHLNLTVISASRACPLTVVSYLPFITHSYFYFFFRKTLNSSLLKSLQQWLQQLLLLNSRLFRNKILVLLLLQVNGQLLLSLASS